jgi:hypothetical protein
MAGVPRSMTRSAASVTRPALLHGHLPSTHRLLYSWLVVMRGQQPLRPAPQTRAKHFSGPLLPHPPPPEAIQYFFFWIDYSVKCFLWDRLPAESFLTKRDLALL